MSGEFGALLMMVGALFLIGMVAYAIGLLLSIPYVAMGFFGLVAISFVVSLFR